MDMAPQTFPERNNPKHKNPENGEDTEHNIPEFFGKAR